MAPTQVKATPSLSTQNSSPEANSWFLDLINLRYAEILKGRNLPPAEIDIPYLRDPQGLAILAAEIRVHMHDQRVWGAAPMLYYRHLMRAGVSAADAGALVGRSAHTIHTGAHSHRLSLRSALRHIDDPQAPHGFMQVSTADIALITAHMDHIDAQTTNAKSVSLKLHSSLYI